MDMTNLTVSALGGGVFGLLGATLNRLLSFFDRWQIHRQEKARWQHEIRLYELQRKMKAEETEQEILLAGEKGSWAGLKTALEAEQNIGFSYRWVNAVRALVRPALTLLLLLISVAIWFSSRDFGLLETLSFNTSAVILWWFGDRAHRRNKKP